MSDNVTRQSILDTAAKYVCQDRNDQYGEPEDSFQTIADVCRNCEGTGDIDTPDIIEGCCGVVKGYKADTDE